MEKKKRCNRHLSCDIFFAPMSSPFFFFQSVCMELPQRLNCGMSMCYEFTLGNWMLSKIIKKLVGRRNPVVSDRLLSRGGFKGGSVEPPKLIFTNVSKRAVSDERLRTNHCDTRNALKIVCLCLLKRAKIT